MDAETLKGAMKYISNAMTENRDYLIELDQQNSDGDLGISMSNGFNAVADFLVKGEEKDLGKLFMKSSAIFNEVAPSSLGTIISIWMMGIAKSLKGKENITLEEFADAVLAGIENIMVKAKSKPGEKTILDALCPGAKVLKDNCDKEANVAFKLAFEAAAEGSESTKQMKSVHGRAAYYGDKSIGVLDGGSVVGKLIFESLYMFFSDEVCN